MYLMLLSPEVEYVQLRYDLIPLRIIEYYKLDPSPLMDTSTLVSTEHGTD